MNDSIPAGFTPWLPSSAFMDAITQLGPVYRNAAQDVLALRIAPSHANMHQVAHGGLLATLADCAFGSCIVQQTGHSVVTAQMSLDYLSSAQVGDWLQAQVQIDRQGRRLIYASCAMRVEQRLVLKANAIFSVRSARPPAAG